MDSNPLVRNYVLKEPHSRFITLGQEMPVLSTPNQAKIGVKDVDYMFVIQGSVEVVCEQFLSHSKQF